MSQLDELQEIKALATALLSTASVLLQRIRDLERNQLPTQESLEPQPQTQESPQSQILVPQTPSPRRQSNAQATPTLSDEEAEAVTQTPDTDSQFRPRSPLAQPDTPPPSKRYKGKYY